MHFVLAAGSDGAFAGGCFFALIYLAIVVLMVAGIWATFVKAGEPGWAAIVPIYNTVVMLKIVDKPLWWIILLFIPFVNIIVGRNCLASYPLGWGKGGLRICGERSWRLM